MINMQLADNPITKILNKKLKLKNFENLSELVNKRDRLKNFQFNFEDLIVDITRQSLDEDVRNDLIELAKFANIKEKIQDLMNSSKINYSENRSVDHFQLRQKERFNSSEWQKLSTFSNKVLNNKKFNYVVNLGGYVDHSNKSKVYKSHFIGCKNLADFYSLDETDLPNNPQL